MKPKSCPLLFSVNLKSPSIIACPPGACLPLNVIPKIIILIKKFRSFKILFYLSSDRYGGVAIKHRLEFYFLEPIQLDVLIL
jgi:hypothetical protein